ncbi:hypothetical protein D3C78_410080 [compost metagenome]
MAGPAGGHDRDGLTGSGRSGACGLCRRAGNAITTWAGSGNSNQRSCPGYSSGTVYLWADRRSSGLARRIFRFLRIDADHRGGVLESGSWRSVATQSTLLPSAHPVTVQAVHDRTGFADQGPAGLTDLCRFFRAMDIYGAAVERSATDAFTHCHRHVWLGRRRRCPCCQKSRSLGRSRFGTTSYRHFAGAPDAFLVAHHVCRDVPDRAGLRSGLARLRGASSTRHQPEPHFCCTTRCPKSHGRRIHVLLLGR